MFLRFFPQYLFFLLSELYPKSRHSQLLGLERVKVLPQIILQSILFHVLFEVYPPALVSKFTYYTLVPMNISIFGSSLQFFTDTSIKNFTKYILYALVLFCFVFAFCTRKQVKNLRTLKLNSSGNKKSFGEIFTNFNH